MEDDGQRHLLVVDEKETCIAHFVPENTFEHIWNQESPKISEKTAPEVATEDEVEYEANKSESVNSMLGKVKPAENPLFRRKVVEETAGEEISCAEKLLNSPKEIAEKFDEIVRDGPKLYNTYLGHTFGAIGYCTSAFVHLLSLLLGNRWAWNILVIIMKLSFAIFLYLVIACSTGIIAIIFNVHDAYVKVKLENNKESAVDDICKTKDDLEVTASFQSLSTECHDMESPREEEFTTPS